MLCFTAKAWNSSIQVDMEVDVPCIFVFGDSLVDNGNNNNIFTIVKSNFWPYGIDFPLGPTGRFTNGRTFVDVLAEILGFVDYIPPFSGSSSYVGDFLKGANFASGAAGIRDETGNYLGINVPMNGQIRNFEKVIEQIREHFRRDEKAVQDYLSKCIIYSGMGNNDYLNNYLLPWQYPTSALFTPPQFARSLLQDYERQLTALYNLGVRKMVLPGIGKMGCIPINRLKDNVTGERPCNEDQNNLVNFFNIGLRNLVDTFNNGRLPGAKSVYLDYFGECTEFESNRQFYGFDVIDVGCCGVGNYSNGGEITCLPFQTPCADRKKYLYWDAFHPSELVHIILAKKAYNDDSHSYAYPIDIKQLAML
uniref:Uncharacterized protein n=2 Tax=Chenopodium quinoa TaxID=63459 RepID=A0A803N1A0_CHEQI